MIEVLKLIQKHNGKWSWYQLERSLAGHEISKSGKLMAVIKELEENGMIRSNVVPGYPDPLYTMTDKGTAYLAKESIGS